MACSLLSPRTFIGAISSPMHSHFHPLYGRLHHGEVPSCRRPTGTRRDVVALPFRAREPQDQHVLGHQPSCRAPCSMRCEGRGTFSRAGHCRRSPSRRTRSGSSSGKWLIYFSRSGRRATGRPSVRARAGAPMECRHGNKFALFTKHVQHLRADPGHDVHIAPDIGTVGQLNADLRDGRTNGTHGEGDQAYISAFHTALGTVPHGLLELVGMDPVVR